MIADTNFVIDLMNGKREAISKFGSLDAPFKITSVTLFELCTGMEFADDKIKEKNKIEKVLKEQMIFPLDSASAEFAGKINGRLIKKGMQISAEDCMIAGIAIKNNESVLTRDEHFKRIEGLKIDSY